MGLPWVRLDSNINQNAKVVELIGQPQGWRAFSVYVFGLGWSGGQGKDGFIPKIMLGSLHGQERHARMLVDVGLWEYTEGGWVIKNWQQYQELSLITDTKRRAQQRAARRTNCLRYHGPQCGCWESEVDSDVG